MQSIGTVFKKLGVSLAAITLFSFGSVSSADTFTVDTEGAHAFVQFRVKHLGYSWLYGRFDDFSGSFTFDKANPENNAISMEVNTASVNTNHIKRDKHIRSDDFLDVEKYPKATFTTTSYEKLSDTTGILNGNLTLHGKTNPISIDITHIGGGKDPWGGYREGFEGQAVIEPDKWGIAMVDKLGPASGQVELILTVEGIRQDSKSKKK